MTHLIIKTEECKGCGKCARDCGRGVLKIENNKCIIVEERKELCIECGHCVAICGRKAIVLNDLPIESLPETNEKVEDVMKLRRSIRRFKSTPIPNEEIQQLLNITKYCPSACNYRPVKFLVINRPKLTEVIKKLCSISLSSDTSSEFLKSVCIRQEQQDVIGREAPHMIITYCDNDPKTSQFAFQDASIFLGQFELFAVQKGYGTFWCGFMQLLLESDEALECVGLKGKKCLTCMGFGIPHIKYKNLPSRKNADVSFLE